MVTVATFGNAFRSRGSPSRAPFNKIVMFLRCV